MTLAWIWTALGTLGVLGALGGYYVPGILKAGGEVVTNRAPLDYDLVPARDRMTPTTSSQRPRIPRACRWTGCRHHTNFSQWAMRHDGVIAEDQAVRVVPRAGNPHRSPLMD